LNESGRCFKTSRNSRNQVEEASSIRKIKQKGMISNMNLQRMMNNNNLGVSKNSSISFMIPKGKESKGKDFLSFFGPLLCVQEERVLF
jgi:hypothetical protein